MKSISSSPTVDSTGSISSSSLASSSPDSGDSGDSDSRNTRGPVDHWLSELPSLYESECSVMLQSKSLQGEPPALLVFTKIFLQVWTNYQPTSTKFTRISRSSRTTHGKSLRVSLNSAGNPRLDYTHCTHRPDHNCSDSSNVTYFSIIVPDWNKQTEIMFLKLSWQTVSWLHGQCFPTSE